MTGALGRATFLIAALSAFIVFSLPGISFAMGAAANATCRAGNYSYDYKTTTKPCKPGGTETCLLNLPCQDVDASGNPIAKGVCKAVSKCLATSILGEDGKWGPPKATALSDPGATAPVPDNGPIDPSLPQVPSLPNPNAPSLSDGPETSPLVPNNEADPSATEGKNILERAWDRLTGYSDPPPTTPTTDTGFLGTQLGEQGGVQSTFDPANDIGGGLDQPYNPAQPASTFDEGGFAPPTADEPSWYEKAWDRVTDMYGYGNPEQTESGMPQSPEPITAHYDQQDPLFGPGPAYTPKELAWLNDKVGAELELAQERVELEKLDQQFKPYADRAAALREKMDGLIARHTKLELLNKDGSNARSLRFDNRDALAEYQKTAAEYNKLQPTLSSLSQDFGDRLGAYNQAVAQFNNEFYGPAYDAFGREYFGPNKVENAAVADRMGQYQASAGTFYDQFGREYATPSQAIQADKALLRSAEFGSQMQAAQAKVDQLKIDNPWYSRLINSEAGPQLRSAEAELAQAEKNFRTNTAINEYLQRGPDSQLLAEKLNQIPADAQGKAVRALLADQLRAWDWERNSALSNEVLNAGITSNSPESGMFGPSMTPTEIAQIHQAKADIASGRISELLGSREASPETLWTIATMTKDPADYAAFNRAYTASDGSKPLLASILGDDTYHSIVGNVYSYGQAGFDNVASTLKAEAAASLNSDTKFRWAYGVAALSFGSAVSNAAEFIGLPTTERSIEMLTQTPTELAISRVASGPIAAMEALSFGAARVPALTTELAAASLVRGGAGEFAFKPAFVDDLGTAEAKVANIYAKQAERFTAGEVARGEVSPAAANARAYERFYENISRSPIVETGQGDALMAKLRAEMEANGFTPKGGFREPASFADNVPEVPRAATTDSSPGPTNVSPSLAPDGTPSFVVAPTVISEGGVRTATLGDIVAQQVALESRIANLDSAGMPQTALQESSNILKSLDELDSQITTAGSASSGLRDEIQAARAQALAQNERIEAAIARAQEVTPTGGVTSQPAGSVPPSVTPAAGASPPRVTGVEGASPPRVTGVEGVTPPRVTAAESAPPARIVNPEASNFLNAFGNSTVGKWFQGAGTAASVFGTTVTDAAAVQSTRALVDAAYANARGNVIVLSREAMQGLPSGQPGVVLQVGGTRVTSPFQMQSKNFSSIREALEANRPRDAVAELRSATLEIKQPLTGLTAIDAPPISGGTQITGAFNGVGTPPVPVTRVGTNPTSPFAVNIGNPANPRAVGNTNTPALGFSADGFGPITQTINGNVVVNNISNLPIVRASIPSFDNVVSAVRNIVSPKEIQPATLPDQSAPLAGSAARTIQPTTAAPLVATRLPENKGINLGDGRTVTANQPPSKASFLADSRNFEKPVQGHITLFTDKTCNSLIPGCVLKNQDIMATPFARNGAILKVQIGDKVRYGVNGDFGPNVLLNDGIVRVVDVSRQTMKLLGGSGKNVGTVEVVGFVDGLRGDRANVAAGLAVVKLMNQKGLSLPDAIAQVQKSSPKLANIAPSSGIQVANTTPTPIPPKSPVEKTVQNVAEVAKKAVKPVVASKPIVAAKEVATKVKTAAVEVKDIAGRGIAQVRKGTPISGERGTEIRGSNPTISDIVRDACAMIGNQCSIRGGERSKSRNAQVKGARRSEHLKGNAIDVSTPAELGEEFARAINTLFCQRNDCGGGFGYYGSPGGVASFHVDARAKRSVWGPFYSGFKYKNTPIGKIIAAPRVVDPNLGPRLAALNQPGGAKVVVAERPQTPPAAPQTPPVTTAQAAPKTPEVLVPTVKRVSTPSAQTRVVVMRGAIGDGINDMVTAAKNGFNRIASEVKKVDDRIRAAEAQRAAQVAPESAVFYADLASYVAKREAQDLSKRISAGDWMRYETASVPPPAPQPASQLARTSSISTPAQVATAPALSSADRTQLLQRITDAEQQAIFAGNFLKDHFRTTTLAGLPKRSLNDPAVIHDFRDRLELAEATAARLTVAKMQDDLALAQANPTLAGEIAERINNLAVRREELRALEVRQAIDRESFILQFAEAQDYTKARLNSIVQGNEAELQRLYGTNWRALDVNVPTYSVDGMTKTWLPSDRQRIADMGRLEELQRRVEAGAYVLKAERTPQAPVVIARVQPSIVTASLMEPAFIFREVTSPTAAITALAKPAIQRAVTAATEPAVIKKVTPEAIRRPSAGQPAPTVTPVTEMGNKLKDFAAAGTNLQLKGNNMTSRAYALAKSAEGNWVAKMFNSGQILKNYAQLQASNISRARAYKNVRVTAERVMNDAGALPRDKSAIAAAIEEADASNKILSKLTQTSSPEGSLAITLPAAGPKFQSAATALAKAVDTAAQNSVTQTIAKQTLPPETSTELFVRLESSGKLFEDGARKLEALASIKKPTAKEFVEARYWGAYTNKVLNERIQPVINDIVKLEDIAPADKAEMQQLLSNSIEKSRALNAELQSSAAKTPEQKLATLPELKRTLTSLGTTVEKNMTALLLGPDMLAPLQSVPKNKVATVAPIQDATRAVAVAREELLKVRSITNETERANAAIAANTKLQDAFKKYNDVVTAYADTLPAADAKVIKDALVVFNRQTGELNALFGGDFGSTLVYTASFMPFNTAPTNISPSKVFGSDRMLRGNIGKINEAVALKESGKPIAEIKLSTIEAASPPIPASRLDGLQGYAGIALGSGVVVVKKAWTAGVGLAKTVSKGIANIARSTGILPTRAPVVTPVVPGTPAQPLLQRGANGQFEVIRPASSAPTPAAPAAAAPVAPTPAAPAAPAGVTPGSPTVTRIEINPNSAVKTSPTRIVPPGQAPANAPVTPAPAAPAPAPTPTRLATIRDFTGRAVRTTLGAMGSGMRTVVNGVSGLAGAVRTSVSASRATTANSFTAQPILRLGNNGFEFIPPPVQPQWNPALQARQGLTNLWQKCRNNKLICLGVVLGAYLLTPSDIDSALAPSTAPNSPAAPVGGPPQAPVTKTTATPVPPVQRPANDPARPSTPGGQPDASATDTNSSGGISSDLMKQLMGPLASLAQMLKGWLGQPETPSTPTPAQQAAAQRLNVSLSAASTQIASGATTTLSWSGTDDATSCALFGPGSERTVLSGITGSISTPTLTQATEFGVLCVGGNRSGTARVIVRVEGSTEDPVLVNLPTEAAINSVLSSGGTAGTAGTGVNGTGSGTGSGTGATVNSGNNEAPVTPPTSGHDQYGNQVSAWCDPQQHIDSFILCLQSLPK